MFPQYSTVTTGACISKVKDLIKKNYSNNKLDDIIYIKEFYQNMHFINSVNFIIKEELPKYQDYYFLFSYHGLPSSNLKKICCYVVIFGNSISI